MGGGKSIVIGICGRTASGKSSLAKRIKAYYAENTRVKVFVISMDDFYKILSHDDHVLALENKVDFDCLDAFDLYALCDCVVKAHSNEAFTYSLYDHANHRHKDKQLHCGGCGDDVNIFIFEGLYLFAIPNIQIFFDIKIYIDIDADTSLIRRIRRDTVERRRTLEGVLSQYESYVKPAFRDLVNPYLFNINITLKEGAFNDEGFEKVVALIQKKL